MEDISNHKKYIVILVPFCLGFIITCLVRTMNAVMTPYISKSLDLSPNEIGFLTAIFFLTYGLFQIPLGIFLDRFGAKKTQSILFVLAGIGLISFGCSNNIYELVFAHIIIGFGIAGGLMAALKAVVQSFPKEKLALVNSLIMTSGGLGILLSATPTQVLMQKFGWRAVNVSYGFLFIFIGLVVYAVVPNLKHELSYKTHTGIIGEFRELKHVFKSKFFWKIAPLVALTLGSFIAFQGLWIEGWFIHVNNISQGLADNYLVIIGLSMTGALLVTGKISQWAKSFKISLEAVLVFFAFLYILDQILIFFNVRYYAIFIWFVYGFTSHIFNLCYAIYSHHFSGALSARANSAQVLLIYIVVFFIDYMIGAIMHAMNKYFYIDVFITYRAAFFAVLILQIAALVWFLLAEKIFGEKITVIET